MESGLFRFASSLGVLRVAPMFVTGSRWTFVALASSRRARWFRFCRVSVSSSPVKCVQVKGLQVSLTSMYERFEASNLLLLSVAPPPSRPFLQAL